MRKSMVQLYADKMNPPVGKAKNDNQLLSESIKYFDILKGVSNIDGKQILSTPDYRAYNISINTGTGQPKYMIAIVYPVLNSRVLEFLVMAAKKDTINGIEQPITDHVCLVKEFKVAGGPPTAQDMSK